MYIALLSVLVGDAMLLSLILLEQFMHRRLRLLTQTVTNTFRTVRLCLQRRKTLYHHDDQILL